MLKCFFCRLLVLSFLVSVSCVSSGEYDDSIHIIKEEGWINETTYSVAAVGSPEQGTGSRKFRSRQVAVMNAQKKILYRFKSLQKQLRSVNNQTTLREVSQVRYDTQSLFEALTRGTIVHIRYDKEENCEILYVIQKSNLKKLIKGAQFTKIEEKM